VGRRESLGKTAVLPTLELFVDFIVLWTIIPLFEQRT
jgi:hypothetical protein